MFTISAAHCWKPSRRTCQAKRRVGAPSLGTLNSRNGAKQQIVSPGAEPIPRLYAAGKLDSRFGHSLSVGRQHHRMPCHRQGGGPRGRRARTVEVSSASESDLHNSDLPICFMVA